jgi:hypothetical protein
MTEPITLEEGRLPTCEGWWARNRGGKVEWFFVYCLEDDAHPGDHYLSIFVSDIEDFICIDQFDSPLTRWAGPIVLPWGEP